MLGARRQKLYRQNLSLGLLFSRGYQGQMGEGLVLGAAGDSAAPWIAFGTLLFGGFLGASIMAHKGRSIGWGFAVGLALSVIGDAILLGVPDYAGRKPGWKWERDRSLRTFFGVLALGCLVMVLALLLAITTEGAASAQQHRGVRIHGDWKSVSCPDGFVPRGPTPGIHHSKGACTVVMANGRLFTCRRATALVASDGSGTTSFNDCFARVVDAP